jgi:alpha-L-fucosidase
MFVHWGRTANLLVNVSPDGAGTIPGWQQERLEAVGAWLDRHAEAVFDTTPGGLAVAVLRAHHAPGRAGLPVLRHAAAGDGGAARRAGAAGERRARARHRAAARNPGAAGGGGRATGMLVIAVPEAAIDPLVTVIEVTVRGAGT